MNVSSVKNLNGETFSAVQDTFLTNIVSSNSANWNEISAYQANSGNFLTAVPAGTMNESAFAYDASDNITAYSGSAFAAQLPEEEEVEFEEINISGISAATDYVTATSGDINATIDNVSANSGAWGGSALPISAGPGIKFKMVNDTLVASTDETVLASGIANDATAFTLSEPAGNFEKIRLIGTYNTCTEVFGNNSRMSWTTDFISESDGVRRNRCYCVSSTDGIHWYEVKVYGYDQSNYTTISPNGGTGWYLETQKIVGLIRTAGN